MQIINHSLVARLAHSLMNANAFLEVNASAFALREIEGDKRTYEHKLALFASAKQTIDDRLMSEIRELNANENVIAETMKRVNAYITSYYAEVKRKRDEREARKRELEAERAMVEKLLAA